MMTCPKRVPQELRWLQKGELSPSITGNSKVGWTSGRACSKSYSELVAVPVSQRLEEGPSLPGGS